MRLSRYEQETIITFNEEEKTAGVYTHNKALIRKLEQLTHDRPDECRLEKARHDGQDVDYIIPKAWVKIIPTRILSEAQLAARKEALKKAHLARKTSYAYGDSEPQSSGMGKCIPQTSEAVLHGQTEGGDTNEKQDDDPPESIPCPGVGPQQKQ